MSELKGSKTEQNLQAAFAGESQANRKYTYYAAAARKAGLNKIADYFDVSVDYLLGRRAFLEKRGEKFL